MKLFTFSTRNWRKNSNKRSHLTRYLVHDIAYYGYTWMKKLVPLAPSITKLALHFGSSLSIVEFKDVIIFENLEALEIALAPDQVSRFHQEKNFWLNFPNLMSLKFGTASSPPNVSLSLL